MCSIRSRILAVVIPSRLGQLHRSLVVVTRLSCCYTENADNDTLIDDDEDDSSTSVDDSQYVVLLVVVPLFLFCYCGSCALYIAWKIYRNCSREALHSKFVHLHAADNSSQMMPPSYPIIHEGLFAKKKDPYQPHAYLNEPMFGAKAAVSFLCFVCITSPSPPLDNIRVMVIIWRLRGNIIRTALCWIV